MGRAIGQQCEPSDDGEGLAALLEEGADQGQYPRDVHRLRQLQSRTAVAMDPEIEAASRARSPGDLRGSESPPGVNTLAPTEVSLVAEWGRPSEGSRLVKAGTCELALAPIEATAEGRGPTEPETADWVRRARTGDGEAFALLVGRYERMILRTALRLLGRMDQAQDAAQETFLRLHRYLARFDESRELGPWLYRIVVNTCRDVARRRASAPLFSLDEVRETEQIGTRVGAEEIESIVSRAEQRRLVQAALQRLPDRERAAIVLRDIEGLPTSDVARILGSSEGTVRSQVSTARLKIKRFVEGQERGR
jgi:RNA polymerase sigma-70 factor (ECF subfamily)